MPSLIYKRGMAIAIISGSILSMGGVAACSKAQTPQALISEAIQYQQKGNDNAAIIQLKNALQKDPNNSEARYLLGKIYLETGNLNSAENELRRSLFLGASPERVLPTLGKTLLQLGKFQKVLDETKQISAQQGSAEISSLRGNAYLALGKSQEAKESFEQAIKYKADFPEALIGLAKHSLLANDIDSATRFSEQAVSQNPEDIDVWLFKGDLLRVQGKTEPAITAYDQALKVQPNNTTAHTSKAALEIASGNFDAAKLDIESARKQMPQSLMVFYLQAFLDFRQGKSAAALESLQQVLRAAPDHMPSILLAGAVQYSLGSMPQAEQYLKKYLEKNPGNLYARKLLVSTLLKSHKTQNAIDALSPVLNDTQQDSQLLALAGESYMQAGEFTKASEYFAKASALAPKSAELHSALGLSQLALGENERAVAEMEAAVNLDAKSSRASIFLVMAHLRLKEYDKAIAAAKVIEKEMPDDPLGYNLEGTAYMGKKDKVSARASFEKAISIQPSNFPAVMNLAKLDVQEKKPDVAKKRLEAFLDKDKKNILALTALASLAQSQGQTKEATALLERASNEHPDSLQPSMMLATQYLKTGEKQKALTLAQKLQGSNPENPEVLDILAQTQFANGDKPAALDTYIKLAVIKPDSALAQFRIASIYMTMENQSAASDALKKALLLQPDYLDAQLAQYSIEIRKANYDEALTIARKIQMQRQKSPVGYVMEGDVFLAQKIPVKAVTAYEHAYELDKSGLLMIKLHLSLSQAGKSKEANSRLNQWITDHPEDVPSRSYLAETYLAGNQVKAAVEQFQLVLKHDPKNVGALNNLAWAYQQEKDPQALEYAEKAFNLAPENVAVLDTMGWILIEQGNLSRGLPLLQKATTLAPDAAEIRYHFVLGLVKSGDKATARKELEQLLATRKSFPHLEDAKALLKQL